MPGTARLRSASRIGPAMPTMAAGPWLKVIAGQVPVTGGQTVAGLVPAVTPEDRLGPRPGAAVDAVRSIAPLSRKHGPCRSPGGAPEFCRTVAPGAGRGEAANTAHGAAGMIIRNVAMRPRKQANPTANARGYAQTKLSGSPRPCPMPTNPAAPRAQFFDIATRCDVGSFQLRFRPARCRPRPS